MEGAAHRGIEGVLVKVPVMVKVPTGTAREVTADEAASTPKKEKP